MKRIKSILVTAGSIVAMSVMAQAAALVTITIDTGSKTLQNGVGVDLSAGTAALGDGAAVQVGYYSGATAGSPFGSGSSTFIPLIGQNSVFGVPTLSIGDVSGNGAGAGQLFSDELNIFVGTNGGANDSLLPLAGTPLVIRFFNGQTIGGSPLFEAINSTAWVWRTPANAPNQPLISLSFDEGTLLSKSGQSTTGSGLRTNTANPEAIPEPSSVMLLSLVGLMGLSRRNRK